MAFDKQRHMTRIQGRPYLPVSARLIWFRDEHPDWAIDTEIVTLDHERQFCVFRATVLNAAGKVMATATKREDVKGFGDYIEKAETGAIGRALGLCGYGTDNDPDFDDGKNGEPSHIVDTPQQPKPAPRPQATYGR